ncbi:IS3 family transposase [Corynebacterium hindlerae]|uniref:IS3 family transposase n=1 Tax=Corynebacterium hindlerae TaxID=699041 RepID=UPI003AABFFBC
MIKICDEEHYRVGYRVVHAILKETGIRVSEKIVREIMAEFDLSPKIKRRRSYSSYKEETDPSVANRLHVADEKGRTAHEQVIELSATYRERVDDEGVPVCTHDFHADAPNQKWVTDISEIPCKDGKLYLSPVIDLHDMYPVSVMVGHRPSVALVTEMIQDAIDQLGPGDKPIIHSDRGFHYRAKAWFETITVTNSTTPVEDLADYRVIPSMSRKATSGDNAAMEGFFGVLKREVFYYHDINPRELTKSQVMTLLDEYITWYVYRRRFKRLGYQTLAASRGLEPLLTDMRVSNGLCVGFPPHSRKDEPL